MDSFTDNNEARIQEQKQKRNNNRNKKKALKAKQYWIGYTSFKASGGDSEGTHQMDQLQEDRMFWLQEQSSQLQAEM